MKIYITGSVASGKSTLAKRLYTKTGLLIKSLDEVVHYPDTKSPIGNSKRTVEERDSNFLKIIIKKNWIIEDTGRPCFEEGFKKADTILLLEPPKFVRSKRILVRFIKQKTGLEKCLYKPSFKMLRFMFKWSKDYDSGKDNLKERLKPYQNKVTILKNNREIKEYLATF